MPQNLFCEIIPFPQNFLGGIIPFPQNLKHVRCEADFEKRRKQDPQPYGSITTLRTCVPWLEVKRTQ